MAYGARLESVLGASPRGFESPILRQMWHVSRRARPSAGLFYLVAILFLEDQEGQQRTQNGPAQQGEAIRNAACYLIVVSILSSCFLSCTRSPLSSAGVSPTVNSMGEFAW